MKIFTDILKAAVLTGALVLTAGLTSCDDERAPRNVNGWTEWAGCRRSSYGFNHKTPDSATMTAYVNKMATSYDKDENTHATGALVWIVGEVSSDEETSCRLNFPKTGLSGVTIPKGLEFRDKDFNEEYLTAFDVAGFDVWLQVEAGYVDIVQLATVVMTKYKSHPCVKGFGIDVEWYKNTEDGEPGTPLDDATAKKVDEAVKAVNPAYSVFVKHWETGYLPSRYRGKNNDMIFVTDSQGFGSLAEATTHYDQWADHYDPNPVFFQIAYNADAALWKSFDNPLKDYGTYILKNLAESDQKRGIIWVDMTFTTAYSLSK